MSGLCGLVAFDREPRGPDLHAMLFMLSHRGVGDPGLWTGRRAALGWWERSTSEPERRTVQPLRASSTGHVLVFDGRLDNRDELVESPALARAGDAEIVLDLYARRGPEAFDALLGDFALALWNGEKETLHLARSPLGVRPLFWCITRDQFLFASEAKAILPVHGVPRELDAPSLRRKAHVRSRDCGETFFKAIRRVVPGTRIELRAGSVSVFPIWRPDVSRRIAKPDSRAYQEAFVRILREAVRCRLPARGHAAVLLSGGVDSAAVSLMAGEAARAASWANRAEAYTWVSDDLPEEQSAAREAAARAGATHVEVRIDRLDPRAELDQRVFELESPFVDAECNWFRALMREASQRGATVLLSGLWGDETMRCHARPADLLSTGRWSAAWGELRGMVPGDFPNLWFGLEYSLRALLRPDRPALRFRTRAQRELHERACGPHSVRRLEEWERAAAWAGLELRVPFLDRRLLDHLLAIPAEERGGKRLLREGLAGHLGERWASPKVASEARTDFLMGPFRQTEGRSRDTGRAFHHWDEHTLQLFRQAFGS
ncbi:MAG: hypothetical protein HYY13_00255 [Nitrospirae bacterium]|nr:hypothetical protein [Nitrospirota bacterium]